MSDQAALIRRFTLCPCRPPSRPSCSRNTSDAESSPRLRFRYSPMPESDVGATRGSRGFRAANSALSSGPARPLTAAGTETKCVRLLTQVIPYLPSGLIRRTKDEGALPAADSKRSRFRHLDCQVSESWLSRMSEDWAATGDEPKAAIRRNDRVQIPPRALCKLPKTPLAAPSAVFAYLT